ncbi:uncharacterized protein LOC107270313 isoform X1 [Cephus cinctus]|uniref:Uncharacterized protein LOC107270313 isoform X1 n=1 Tax=Cephus cinctus TaxID=211228 RepID=A0AAJ7C3N9_CEPCN|nr:uncharacterized protein LOC107270313 isoform X1 [Cephus cinctus]
MRWCQFKLGVLLLVAASIFCTKADHVADEPIVATDSINESDAVFLGLGKTVNIVEPSLTTFTNPEVTEVKDGFQQSIHLPYEHVSDRAYWDSIYGTDDIPEFDTPPEIQGDTIILRSINKEVDGVDNVAFPFTKRSTDPGNLERTENDEDMIDHQWNINGKRSNPRVQTYRDDRSYRRNPFSPDYYEDQENPRIARQFESDSTIVQPEKNFRNDFDLRDFENMQIMRESNRPMRTVPLGTYSHHTKHVPRLNAPKTTYRSVAASAKAFAGSSRSNGGSSFVDEIAEKSDAYAKSEASSSGTIIIGGPRASSGTSPVTESSKYYILDGSDSSKLASSSTASAISRESEKSISNYGYRRNMQLRPKHGTTHSHVGNLHKLFVNHPGCGCSKKTVIQDQGSLIVSDKKTSIKHMIDTQSTISSAHASASSQVNMNQALSAESAYSGAKQNLDLEAGQLNDVSVSQASASATVVEAQESQTGISGTIGTQEAVSQSIRKSAQASAASEHHESISGSATDRTQISSVNEGSVIPFVKDSVHLGSSIAGGAVSAGVTDVIDRASSQAIGTKENVLSGSSCASGLISGSELSTSSSGASAISVSDKITTSNQEVVGSKVQSTAYVVNDVKSGTMNEESIINSARDAGRVVQEHQEFDSAGQTIVNSEVNAVAEAGSAASHVAESSAHAAGSVLVESARTFVKPTSALIGSHRAVIAPHSVLVNPVPAVVGGAASLATSAVGSLANVAQEILRAKEGVVNNIAHAPEYVIVDSDLVSDEDCDENHVDVIVDDIIDEQPYSVNLPAHPGQYIGYDQRIGAATAANRFIGSNVRTGGHVRTALLTDKSVISSADASSRVSVAGSAAGADSVATANQVLIDNNLRSANAAGNIAQSSAVAGSAAAVETSKISLGSAAHSVAAASATAVAASEVSAGTSVHSSTKSSASAVAASEASAGTSVHSSTKSSASAVQASVESALTSSAHVASAEQQIVNDYVCDGHSVNVGTGATVRAKGNAATHSTVENVQQIHSSAMSQETHVASSASATSQVVEEHSHPVQVSDVESYEDGSFNIQHGTVFGAAAAASATSSASTGLSQSVVQNAEQVVTNRHSAIASSHASINAQEGSAAALLQGTVGSSARAKSEVISADQGLVQSGVEVGHVIVNADSEIVGADACASSSNLADQAVIAGSNLHTGGHVIVNSHSGLTNVHSHAVGSISDVSSQSTQINQEHVQSAAHSVSESLSSQSAASATASASASSVIIDQSVSSSAGGVKSHTIQLDDDCDVDSADLIYSNHGLGNSQSQSRSQSFASAQSSANSNVQSRNQVGHKLTQINNGFVNSAGHSVSESVSSQSAASASASASSAIIDQSVSSSAGGVKGHTIQLDDDYDVDSADLTYLNHGLGNSQSQSHSQAFASAQSSANSNAQSSTKATASTRTEQINLASAASASQVVASKQDLIQSEVQSGATVAGSNANVITSSTNTNAPCDVADESIADRHTGIESNVQISSSLDHANSVASSVAGSSVNSIAEAESRISATESAIDSTVGNVNQFVIGSQAFDVADYLSAPKVQEVDIVINSESGMAKAASSSSSSIESSSSTSQSSSSVIDSSSTVSGVSSLAAQSDVAASAKSATATEASISQLDRNLYAGAKVSQRNDHGTRARWYNNGRIPVQKTKLPIRQIYIVENDPRNVYPVNAENYGSPCDDELEEEVDDDILKSAIDKGSRLVERVINDAAIEYNMNENTGLKEKIVDLAVRTVKNLVSNVASEAARKISYGEVDRADSELENYKSTISNSGFDFVDMGGNEKCPIRGNWNTENLHDYDWYHNRPRSHRNRHRGPYYDDNSNRFVAEKRNRYRNERGIDRQDGNAFERKFLDNLYFDGKIHHFEFLNEKFIPSEAEIDHNKLYNLNLYDNTRFIDLDLNCSDASMCMTPECKRLDYSLKSPNEGNPIPLRFIKTHLSQGHDLALGMHDRARWLVSGGFQPKPHTGSMLHFLNNKVEDSIVKIHEESELTLFAAKLLQERLSTEYDFTPNTLFEFLHNHGFRVTGSGICQTRPKRCSSFAKYRSYDGSCNNFHNPRWGQANTAFTRVVPPRYSDGIHKIPVSVTGDELPNVRELSVQLFQHRNISNADFTLAVVQWGQVLSHDFAHQIMDQTIGGGIECCSSDGHEQLPKSLQHHSCMPIVLSPRDKFYSKYGQRCMNFVRSMTVSKDDCTLGPAEQLNGATSYLDCSPMYGSDKNTCDSLRVFHGGLLKTEIRQGRSMMPTTTDRSRFCDIRSPSEVCYKGGDVRVNQNPHLVVLQTLLVREHNRLAEELSKLNRHWSDEQIFQEARKIVIAEYQHITYHEWLPVVLGKQYCKKHRLIPIESIMTTDYNSRVNPAVINGFATAAFRFFHSMVDGNLDLCPMDRSIAHSLRLSNHYFRPQIVERSNNFDDLVRGFVTQPMMAPDRFFDSELTEYLFRSRNEYGLDLEAIDIQRSRDHGLPGYNAYRKICKLRYAEDFDDLIGEIPREGIEKLRNIYAHVDDIDLLVGGSMETPIAGGILGPTVRCLVGEQFYRSRVSDRYFYDNANFPHSFTEEQYEEVKKVSLARLICDTSDDLKEIQYHAFKTISWKNPLIPCCDIPKLNLTAWQE